VIQVGINLASQVERHHVWVTAVIDEPGLITVEHAVKAKREEFIEVCLLDDLLALISLSWVVQVEQVRQAICIVIRAPHVTLLLAHNLSKIFH